MNKSESVNQAPSPSSLLPSQIINPRGWKRGNWGAKGSKMNKSESCNQAPPPSSSLLSSKIINPRGWKEGIWWFNCVRFKEE